LLHDWIERAKSGDAAAWEALVTAHRARVYRTALRLLGEREDALDASQEVFMRMHAYLNRFDTRKELAPWLYAMTVNACRDLDRKRQRDGRRVSSESVEAQALVAPRGPGRIDAEIERGILERGLRTLSEGERAAIVLRDVEGLSTKEVAEVLRVTEVTIRSQISRARVKLREYRRKALGNDDVV
jgi:RNA polymerase sigma-70 factor (ECF subfamily)